MTKIPLVQCGASRIGLGRSVGGGGVAVAGGIATGRNAVGESDISAAVAAMPKELQSTVDIGKEKMR